MNDSTTPEVPETDEYDEQEEHQATDEGMPQSPDELADGTAG